MLSASRAVSSSPLETGCLRCAWSCPLSSERFEVEPQGPEAEVAGLGVAVALRKLLSSWIDPVRRLSSLSLRRFLRIGTHVRTAFARQGWLPALFNERVARLTADGAPIPSFPFVEFQGGPWERLPPEGVVHQFVMVLVSRLQLSVAVIVLAYALVSSPAPPAYLSPAQLPPILQPGPSPARAQARFATNSSEPQPSPQTGRASPRQLPEPDTLLLNASDLFGELRPCVQADARQ